MDAMECRARELISLRDERISAFGGEFEAWKNAKVSVERMAANIDSYVERALVSGQIEARVFRNYPKAKSYFTAGADIANRALEERGSGYHVVPKYLATPMYCVLLSGRYEEVVCISRAVLERPRVPEDAAFYDGFARVLSAAVLDDGGLLAEERKWVDTRRSKQAAYWWETAHGVYHDLLGAITERNLERFLKLMDAREAAYAGRPKDRKMRDAGLKDGGSVEQNSLVIDYMGTAIAMLARHRGMCFDYDSKFVPAGLL